MSDIGDLAYDYTNSGLSTVQAIDDAALRNEAAFVAHNLPRFLARLLKVFMNISMSCDGVDCPRVGKTSGKLNENGVWARSGGWVHNHDLDFCRTCQFDGSMHAAITAGTRPRGAPAPAPAPAQK